ncbi:DNA polymerase III subunit delta [Porphyromonas sp. COT-290 OH860]|uniref:DNA polymerase III subunit delta n=1 Tax=Porphyromonas sp. COT-290 OH860 TaxID=1515615 RepID=UPI00052CF051|nr:DNA polymerase III subunit delta [Porphyromonas sp. COT-290 OH860]KGN83693.1 DNA polymerase III subunit delta [Porphyromonas sp. COT-290 OH860]
MPTYEDIVRKIKKKSLASAYMLWGEEPLFIDKLAEVFASELIPEDERDFNLSVLYGHDVAAKDIISEAMRFPLMGQKHLVLVREAQMIKDLEQVAPYIPSLPDTTCLVLCYKKKADKRRALYKALEAIDGLYESSKIYDSKIPDFIIKSFSAVGLNIEPRTAYIMADHTGNDLEKILSEVDKLSIALSGASSRLVTPELIERHIGISKEYNNFELLRAVVERDAAKAFKVAYYFAANEKNYPIQTTLPVLFNYFSTLMAVYYLPQINERSVGELLKVGSFQVRDYLTGARLYSSGAVFEIIRRIRLADAASKGVDASLSSGEILKELLGFIFSR